MIEQEPLTISGEVIVGDVTFAYAETRSGTNRGIAIYRPGQPKDKHSYNFSPNPHDDRWYNKHQPEFYRLAAVEIGTFFVGADAYPPFGTIITVHEIDYDLVER